MTPEELNFIKDSFSQIIDDIAGNPDWQDAASAVASNLGTLERELEKKVIKLPSNIGEMTIQTQLVTAHCVESSNPASENIDKPLHCITLVYEDNGDIPYILGGDEVKFYIKRK